MRMSENGSTTRLSSIYTFDLKDGSMLARGSAVHEKRRRRQLGPEGRENLASAVRPNRVSQLIGCTPESRGSTTDYRMLNQPPLLCPSKVASRLLLNWAPS